MSEPFTYNKKFSIIDHFAPNVSRLEVLGTAVGGGQLNRQWKEKVGGKVLQWKSSQAAAAAVAAETDDGGKEKNTVQQLLHPGSCLERGSVGRPT